MMSSFKRWMYGHIERRFLDGCSNFNSLEVRRNSRTKRQARDQFAAHDIPHAKGEIFFWPWQAFRFVKEHGYPVVVKPNLGGYSRGSHFPIRNARELVAALMKVKIWWPMTVIEQYLRGKNYRVVVTRDGVQLVTRRFPPFVVGDGESSISALIDAENLVRDQMQLLPTIHHIPKDKRVQKFLRKQGLSLDSVPAAGEDVELYHRIALDPGGSLETIELEAIPAENQQLFQRILEIFDAEVLGIDVILEEGIEKPIAEQRGIFLEVNSRPYLKMHRYPRWGEVPDMDALEARLGQRELSDTDLF